MRPWFERRPSLLAREEESVASAYSNLYWVVADGVVRVRGGLPVRVGTTVVDHFQIEVRLADDHPASHPFAREVGGRIAWLPEHHVNDDGQICLFLPEEASAYWKPGSTVRSFVEGPLNSYFVGYLHYREFGAWPFGERAHRTSGVLDFYAETTGLTDPVVIAAVLQHLKTKPLRGHLACICGSGRILRQCHPGVLRLASTMSPASAAESLERLLRGALTANEDERLHTLRKILTTPQG